MAIAFKSLSSAEGLKELNEYLLTRSYISGYEASKDDLAVYSALESVSSEYANVSRWYKHIAALLGNKFSGASVGVTVGEAAAPAPSTPSVAEANTVQPPKAEDDDDLDLFGEETEEEKAAQAEREAKAKKPEKKKESGKSSVLLDVKPWDDETDLAQMEAYVRSVKMDGLLWGASKLVPLAYGIKKMTIMMTIVDDLVSLDELIEDHLTAGEGGEFIQSCDVVAFNKI